MKKLMCYVWLLFPYSLFAQSCDCESGQSIPFYRVTAQSGLIMRDKASIKGHKIALIPYKTNICGCRPFQDQPYEAIDGVYGTWVKVFYLQYSGYAFNGYLEQTEGSDLRIDVDSNSQNEWGTNYWTDTTDIILGLFETKQSGTFLIEPITYKDTIRNIYRDGQYSTKKVYTSRQKVMPKLILAGNWDKNKRRTEGYYSYNKILLPGDMYWIYAKDARYVLYATGVLVKSDKEHDPPYKSIKNYEIILRKYDKHVNLPPEEQVIARLDQLWFDALSANRYVLVWFGDLDQDGKPDLLLQHWIHHEGAILKCYLSKDAAPPFMLKKHWEKGIGF